MWQTEPVAHEASEDPPRRVVVDEVASHLAEALGLDIDPVLLHEAAQRALGLVSDSPDPLRVVLAICDELGLRASKREGRVKEMLEEVGPLHPAVVVNPNGRFVVLRDRRGGRVERVVPGREPAKWVGAHEFARSMSSAPDDRTVQGENMQWVSVDPPGVFRPMETVVGGDEPPDDEAGDSKKKKKPTPMRRLLALIRAERLDLGVVVVYAVGVGILGLTTPIAVEVLVNTVAFGTLRQPLVVLTLLLLGGLLFSAALRAMQTWVVEILQRRLFLRLVADLAHRLPRVEVSAFDRANGPELLNRYFDIFTIQKAAASLLLDGLNIVLTSLVGLIVLAFYHPYLLAFDIVLLGVVMMVLWILGRGATASAVQESYAKYEVAGWLEEVARHPVAFKLAGGPELARRRTDQLAATYLLDRKTHFRVVFRQVVGALFLYAVANAGVLGIGGFLVIERQLTLGQLVAAELIVSAVVASFAKIGKHLETFYDLLASLDKVGGLTDLPVEEPGDVTRLPECSASGSHLVARHVSFAFPGRPDILRGVDFELAAGERVALTGVSGSGRSALLDLLVGMREPTHGRVELDGVDVRDIHRSVLRERAAMVKGNEVIVGSLFDNVSFGRDLDRQEVRYALSRVGLLDDVDDFPDGLNTELHSTGAPLSQGQMMRLTLARAIAGDPSLLIIDRALDGLDPQTREIVLRSVFDPQAPWTLLVVTDDPAVAVRCTRSLVLSNGSCREGEGHL
jgi:putative ABC transport system ATP-binding protein